MAEKKSIGGIRPEQKLKSFLILDWMKKNTDRFHTKNADKIAATISDGYGIPAERRSVYRDIDAINAVVLIAHGDAADFEEAVELVQDGQETIVYDATRKGYYYDNVFCDFEDIRLAAECIYAAKFIDKARADRIIEEIICKDISKYQKKDIMRDIFVSDRVRTSNKTLYRIIETITEAMRHRVEDDADDLKTKYKHRPEQISFQYTTYKLNDLKQQAERAKGAEYIVSPYRLMVCDGNYYLLAYNMAAKRDKVRMYRVDRMKNVKRIKGSEREGFEEVEKIDLETYTKTHFGMYSGVGENVTIRFTNDLLDAVVDRFGTKDVIYRECDKNHFEITTRVHVSPPFYGWVFGFGNKAKILSPAHVVEKYKEYLKKVFDMHEKEE